MKYFGLFLILFSFNSLAKTRVISSAPSLTQTFVSLGLSEKLVGVSDYCDKEINLPRIGSLITPNIEKIFSLKPDWVLLLGDVSSDRLTRSLDKIKISYSSYSYNSYFDVKESIVKMGKDFNRGADAKMFIEKFSNAESKLISIKTKGTFLYLISVNTVEDNVKDILASANGTYFSDIVEFTGLKNLATKKGSYVKYDSERLHQMKPDYVFVSDKLYRDVKQRMKLLKILKNKFKNVKKIFFLHEDSFFVPGPKLYLLSTSIYKEMTKND